MADFLKSKTIGKMAEKLLHNYLTLAGLDPEFNSDKETRSEHDLTCKIGRKTIKFEVKLDYLACKTGNMAIEIGNPQKETKTGIEITLADLWTCCIKDDTNWTVWITSVKTLKDYMKRNQGRRIERVGDGNSTIVLYKCDDILGIFKRIDNVTTDKILPILKSLLK